MTLSIRHMSGWVAALLTGVLFALSLDVGPVGPLALVAPVPILLFALRADRASPVALWAFVARIIGAAAFVFVYAGQLPAPVMMSALLIYGIEFTVVMLITRLAGRQLPAWLGVFSYPVLTTACEYLLEMNSPHGTYGALGYSLTELLPLTQLASLGGVAALTFMASLVPMAIALWIVRSQQWRTIAIAAASPWLAAITFGLWRLSLPYEGEAHVALGALDGLTMQAVVDEQHADDVARQYAQLIRQMGSDVSARPLTLVLPEKAFAYRIDWGMNGIATLQQAADESGITVVAGFNEEIEPGKYANTARVFSPHIDQLRYLKHKLIPGLESQFVSGKETLIGSAGGVVVCKDMDFPALLREYGSGTPLMLVPAWDFHADGKLHSRMAVLRGIENGFAVARSAAMGRQTISDAFGRIVAERITDASNASTLDATIGLVSVHTFYTRAGDVFAWFTVASAAMIVLTVTRNWYRKRANGMAPDHTASRAIS